MRYILAVLIFIAPVQAFAFETVAEFQPDFAVAKPCKPIDGRQVWQGKKAYYIQNWMFWKPGPVDPDTAGVVAFKDNKKSDLKPFAAACK